MRKRRSLNRAEQSQTITAYLKRKRLGQKEFAEWLLAPPRGILISPQYLNDVIRGRRDAGPKFKAILKEITGVTLVDGLVEDEEG